MPMSYGDRIIFARDCKAKPSSHRCWSPRLLRMSPVDAGQQISELRGRDRHYSVGQARPQETAPLQALREQARALTIVPDHLQQVAATTTEAKQMTAQRVAMQNLLDLQGERWKTLPHVGVPGCKPHPYPGRNRNHRCRPLASAAIAAVTAASST